MPQSGHSVETLSLLCALGILPRVVLMTSLLRASKRVSPAARLAGNIHRRCIWGVAPDDRDSLIVPLPDSDSPVPLFDGPTPTKVTTLANGLKVASSDLPAPGTTVGLYVETGSRYDSVPGTAHVLQHMAYKSSVGKSQLMMVRDAERIGAAVACTAARENMVYQVDTLKESAPEAVGLLAQTACFPKFLPWEVQEQSAVIVVCRESVDIVVVVVLTVVIIIVNSNED